VPSTFSLTRKTDRLQRSFIHSAAIRCVFTCAILALFARSSFGAATIDPAQVQRIEGLLESNPTAFAPAFTNRFAWNKAAAEMPWLIPEAEELAAGSEPEISDDLYLDYSRTGNRDRGQKPQFERTRRLAIFALAECVENKDRFLPPLERNVEAICHERSWTYAAHDGRLDVFYGRAMNPDLRATALAFDLATADYLLGAKLPADIRQLIRQNVHQRVLEPFRDMVEGRLPELSWLRIKNNWNAVCLAGTIGAALALEDSRPERAWFLAAAEHYVTNFLAGFPADGYCGEGIGYWNYGFGHYVMLTESIRQATDGKEDLFKWPQSQPPALFGFRSEVLNGIYPSISDCAPGEKPDPEILRYVAERFDLPRLATPTHMPKLRKTNLAQATMSLFQGEPLPVATRVGGLNSSPLRSWFSNGGVLIGRPAPGDISQFAVVLKGGHNAESHNHNDVGSFSVVAGNSMVICDPGGEVYTSRTFGPHRYDSKVINSFGHAVPIVAGKLQRTGAAARAEVLRADFTDGQDTLALDLKSAYPVPELKKLVRTFVYSRGASPSLSVQDQVVFDKSESFESAIITWGEMKTISPNEFILVDGNRSVRVKVDSAGLPLSIYKEKIEEDVHTPRKPWHIGIALQNPATTATVTLTITP
jgi:hypothetical protein